MLFPSVSRPGSKPDYEVPRANRNLFNNMLLCALVVILPGCLGGKSSESREAEANGPQRGIRVLLCTTGMVGDMARAVAGPDVEVQVLMGPGVDPHLFSPSPQDVEKMARADAILYSGLHLEAGLAAYLERLSRKNPRVHSLSDGLQSTERLIPVGGALHDPHFWNDLELWIEATLSLGRKLGEWDPPRAEAYQARADVYATELQELLDWALTETARLPEENRILVTAHDAFGYLGRSLNLQVTAVQGISTNTEASVRKVEELVELIVTRKVPAIFSESSVSDKPIRAILDGCRRRNHPVRLGGVLYSDTPGPPGSGAETFLGMYRTNLETILEGLTP